MPSRHLLWWTEPPTAATMTNIMWSTLRSSDISGEKGQLLGGRQMGFERRRVEPLHRPHSCVVTCRP